MLFPSLSAIVPADGSQASSLSSAAAAATKTCLNDLSTAVTDGKIVDEDYDARLEIDEADEMLHDPGTASLDYIINDNGSCTCKICAEVVASRTHWYRHKYKVRMRQFVYIR